MERPLSDADLRALLTRYERCRGITRGILEAHQAAGGGFDMLLWLQYG